MASLSAPPPPPDSPSLPQAPSHLHTLGIKSQQPWQLIERLQHRRVAARPCSRCRGRQDAGDDVVCQASVPGRPSKKCVPCILAHTYCDVTRIDNMTLVLPEVPPLSPLPASTAVSLPTSPSPNYAVRTDLPATAASSPLRPPPPPSPRVRPSLRELQAAAITPSRAAVQQLRSWIQAADLDFGQLESAPLGAEADLGHERQREEDSR
ncbi:MAG: hypothetical protein M1826_007092 [Phylliscum demangeonii]|nr:MAG: hypothetical protein M1826_007092 [Phylliscum demangeonii]